MGIRNKNGRFYGDAAEHPALKRPVSCCGGVYILYIRVSSADVFDRIRNFSLACNRISEILQDYYDLPKAIDAEKSGV